MGTELELYTSDESIESPFIHKSFLREIIWEDYFKFDAFLTAEEIKIIQPNIYGEIVLGKNRKPTILEKARLPFILNKAIKGKITAEEINKLRDKIVHRSEKIEDRERNPVLLKQVLEKVEKYLIDTKDQLPLVHYLYEQENAIFDDYLYEIEINGVYCNIEGDLFFYKNYETIRNKIHLKSYQEDYGNVDFFIEVEKEMLIDNQVYYSQSISKAEQFENEFKKCYDFLDEAISRNQKVLWEFD